MPEKKKNVLMFSSTSGRPVGDLGWVSDGTRRRHSTKCLHSFSSFRCAGFVLADAETESGRGDVVVNREEGKLDGVYRLSSCHQYAAFSCLSHI